MPMTFNGRPVKFVPEQEERSCKGCIAKDGVRCRTTILCGYNEILAYADEPTTKEKEMSLSYNGRPVKRVKSKTPNLCYDCVAKGKPCSELMKYCGSDIFVYADEDKVHITTSGPRTCTKCSQPIATGTQCLRTSVTEDEWAYEHIECPPEKFELPSWMKPGAKFKYKFIDKPAACDNIYEFVSAKAFDNRKAKLTVTLDGLPRTLWIDAGNIDRFTQVLEPKLPSWVKPGQ